MHPLWKVLNLTSEFKFAGEMWRASDEPDDNDGNIMVIHQATNILQKFNPYCLVEPGSIDMG